MKRIAGLILLLPLFLAGTSHAQQKIAYVDIAAIMKALPEAQDAQSKLDALVESWQKELEAMEKEWQKKFNDYDKRKLILTDQGRANAERELQELDRQIMEFREKKFGQNGELFAKENELMQPIQNVVFQQIQELAVELGYDYVFDKSGGVSIIYAKDTYDLTNKAIDRIKKMLPARTVSGQGETPQTPPREGGRPTPTPTPDTKNPLPVPGR
ncbi:MAG: OmpH family outer membrane protein [Bacteroidota bacterium]|nr:OmpH family outer membrane protein [Bacteroidota bacterium]